MRPPPVDIEILLPVWGERYTRDFLTLSLPSLLAPGNVPAVSRLGRCTFVLLAPAWDAEIVANSPLWALLRRCCAVRVHCIDDLISLSSSTVLTLAYASVIREAGERAPNICFVPLVADYVVSDGSLVAVVERVFAGASGVLAGNFQVARTIALPWLEELKDDAGVLAVPSRTLVELSLKALHRTTLADIVRQGQSLKAEINRLFWWVNDGCMVGRFFLMHMIAIRPETSDFIIAAASDYSFIPELCPSGNIVHMTDSDDYFVVECQPQDLALPTTAAPPLEPRSVAKAVETWATATHYDNARHALIFHAGVPSSGLAGAIAASEKFIAEVKATATSSMPFRHHPAWERSLDYHLATARLEQDLVRLATITADRSLVSGPGAGSRLRSVLLGRAPHFQPWHPRWPDVRALRLILTTAVGNMAIVSDASARVRSWLDALLDGQGGRSTTHIRPEDIPDEINAGADGPGARFDCLFLIADQFPAPEMLRRIASLVQVNGAIVLAIGRIFSEGDFSPLAVPSELVPADGPLRLEETAYVTTGACRRVVQGAMMRHARSSVGQMSLEAAYRFAVAGGLAAISMFFNVATVLRRSATRSRCSSLFLTLRKVGR